MGSLGPHQLQSSQERPPSALQAHSWGLREPRIARNPPRLHANQPRRLHRAASLCFSRVSRAPSASWDRLTSKPHQAGCSGCGRDRLAKRPTPAAAARRTRSCRRTRSPWHVESVRSPALVHARRCSLHHHARPGAGAAPEQWHHGPPSASSRTGVLRSPGQFSAPHL